MLFNHNNERLFSIGKPLIFRYNALMHIIFDYNRTIYDPEKLELYEGVYELLNKLSQEHKLYLVSKNEPGRGNIITELGIADFFNQIIFVDNKTATDFQKLVGAETNVIVVGDRVKGEIKIGKMLGYKTVWVRQGKFKDELPENENEEPDTIIDNIVKLLSVLP